jgi:ferric-dicitrate binding protein FerR (iron transport regulator)
MQHELDPSIWDVIPEALHRRRLNVEIMASKLAAHVERERSGVATDRRGKSRSGTASQEGGALWRKAAYTASSLAAVGVVALVAFMGSGLRSAHRLLSVRTYTTGAGQHATIALADGSRAQLGPVTTLAVTVDPTRNRVDARVSGEVLFTVTHRPHTSFQVSTENTVTRVLGTTFLVRRYPTDQATQVMVADGRVSLSGTHKNARRFTSILTTRMLGVVDDSGRVSVTPNIAVDDYTAWTAGRLVFRNTPLRNVVAEVGRAYDVNIRIADSTLAKQAVDWTLPLAQRSLTDVLESLSDVLDAHPVRTGRIITFVAGRSPVRRSLDVPSSSTQERQYGK